MSATDRLVARLVGYNLALASVGAFIIVVWAFAIVYDLIRFAPAGGIFLASIIVIFGLLIHFVALSTGNHFVSWGASIFVALLALLAVVAFPTNNRAELAVLAGASILSYNETLRLSFAHRRGAKVAQNVYLSSTFSILGVVLLSVVGLEFAKLGVDLQPTNPDGRSLRSDNWWILVSVAALVVAFLATLFIPSINKRRQSAPRLRPGHRIDPTSWDDGQP